ncbi:hypothetical protein FQA47_011061 [Oryzias melastigma]|uniref:Uncharacterized protein n=1 Tax=Oryzias melastigma TaxID=30732 RepID=A0A834EZZ3_ORYME|nr:hypothetical protein FQA47_011061 [Oryzias melastigma]
MWKQKPFLSIYFDVFPRLGTFFLIYTPIDPEFAEMHNPVKSLRCAGVLTVETFIVLSSHRPADLFLQAEHFYAHNQKSRQAELCRRTPATPPHTLMHTTHLFPSRPVEMKHAVCRERRADFFLAVVYLIHQMC